MLTWSGFENSPTRLQRMLNKSNWERNIEILKIPLANTHNWFYFSFNMGKWHSLSDSSDFSSSQSFSVFLLRLVELGSKSQFHSSQNVLQRFDSCNISSTISVIIYFYFCFYFICISNFFHSIESFNSLALFNKKFWILKSYHLYVLT